MDRPLWQILLAMLLVGLAVERAAVGFVLYESALVPALFVAYGLQVAAAVATALGMWLGRPWTIVALLALGATLVAAALLESLWLGVRPAISAASEVLIVLLSTGALALVLRHEFGGGASHSSERGPDPATKDARLR